jgi:hypothetical protein
VGNHADAFLDRAAIGRAPLSDVAPTLSATEQRPCLRAEADSTGDFCRFEAIWRKAGGHA